MSYAASGSVSALSLDPPDSAFRLVVGLYVAILVVPVVLYATTGVGVADPAVLYGVFLLSGLVVVAAVTWGLGSVEGGAVRLGDARSRWLLPVLPVVLAAGSFAVLSQIGGAAVVGFFLGVVGVPAGIAVAAMAHSRYVKAVLDTLTAEAEWRSGWPERARHRLYLLVVAVMIVGIVCIVVGAVRDGYGALTTIGQFLFTFGVVLATIGQPQNYTATDAGLAVGRGGLWRLYPWDGFSGYTRTDDTLVCHRPWRVDVRFAVTDLDDSDAVERAVARYLHSTA
jgi:hypothetical protein